MKRKGQGIKTERKVRNYSFRDSKRLPPEKMTEISGIKIPSIPGTCYHAIICAFAENKDKFVYWNRLFELVSRNMRKYGGDEAWKTFLGKDGVKAAELRIKENVHTLTRRGRDCYGYRLHEMGMAIYYFKDGALLITGGEMRKKSDGNYDVLFPSGRKLQARYRGTTMTFREYKRFLEHGYIDPSGTILDPEGIRAMRANINKLNEQERMTAQVCIVLGESYDQETACRLEALGLRVEQQVENELVGTIPLARIAELKEDRDVAEVEYVTNF